MPGAVWASLPVAVAGFLGVYEVLSPALLPLMAALLWLARWRPTHRPRDVLLGVGQLASQPALGQEPVGPLVPARP